VSFLTIIAPAFTYAAHKAILKSDLSNDQNGLVCFRSS